MFPFNALQNPLKQNGSIDTKCVGPIMPGVHKMVKHALKIL